MHYSFLKFSAHGVLHDILREYNSSILQGPAGPPGPPGPPGSSRWFGSHGNVTELLEYIKCKYTTGLLFDMVTFKWNILTVT